MWLMDCKIVRLQIYKIITITKNELANLQVNYYISWSQKQGGNFGYLGAHRTLQATEENPSKGTG